MSLPRGVELLDALESGTVRVARRDDAGAWHVDPGVKEALLEIFREDEVVPHWNEAHALADLAPGALGVFRDKRRLKVRVFSEREGVRVVPGGSAVRRGAYLAPGVVCMPPMYVNVGAWIGEGSMIDSHALVGSCAQIGARVHVSAGVQVGGVLEPVGALPVIVEDDVFLGGQSGLYEGVVVREGAVLAAGVSLTATSRLYDVVNELELRGTREAPLEVPARAVVVPGTRPLDGDWARERGLSAACALVVKYRDERTSGATALEDALR